MQEPEYNHIIAQTLNLRPSQIENVLKLLQQENTVPFIARYRKEATGNLEETTIRMIAEKKEKLEKLYSAQKSTLEKIASKNQLTNELKTAILQATSIKEIELLYAPYKQKRKTRATIAIEKGFANIAEQLYRQQPLKIPSSLLANYPQQEIIDGACAIISQRIADDNGNRQQIREYYQDRGKINSTYSTKLDELTPKAKEQVHKFSIYKDFQQPIEKLKAYQILALFRGEKLGILKVKLVNEEPALQQLQRQFPSAKADPTSRQYLETCIKEGYKKIFASTENEIRTHLKEKAELESVSVFQKNLQKLLMTKPRYGTKVLAIDPGYRTGCKLAIIDQNTNPLAFDKIFLHKPEAAIAIIEKLIQQHKPDLAVIGNGTAGNETAEFLQKHFSLPITMVNESGASVYSASKIGGEEFPDLDATERGTVSIGRRFIDPLSELVKIPVESIGVGMYQHDVDNKLLKQKLSYVVEDVVNSVGINVNTASSYLLKEISGLDARMAKKIIKNKPYRNREELSKILSEKAYQQAAGFLRIPESSHPFDNTAIHPEQYRVANYIIDNKIQNYPSHAWTLKNIYTQINQETFLDILAAYQQAGQDPRKHEAVLITGTTHEPSSIKIGKILPGIVRNITTFGAFIDIGLKNDGLVHISEIANEYIRDPADVLDVGQQVTVKIISLDLDKNKIGLSIRQS